MATGSSTKVKPMQFAVDSGADAVVVASGVTVHQRAPDPVGARRELVVVAGPARADVAVLTSCNTTRTVMARSAETRRQNG